ncbi:10817_t:CDS:2 [Gigaspora rosea]|nr:10817_t:CDS:2 [Gigaspora rosea]
MATRLDYIFVDEQNAQYCQKMHTKFGNLDYFIVATKMKFYKNELQSSYWKSLVRARRVLKAPESSIQKLNRKINRLEKKVARNKDLSDLQLVIERLRRNLQEELANLADK